ncbi:MAG TPA: translocation/assembly module TamB domain-containing protein [Saprospiraceae bacterium]|nr:translocation/assembly module TamB domain-containing protein [Saprospiraceae bacterium]HMP24496.1 translocation/assembly module TamB domain-containing protein [Saprospiraceae bacterium]
MIPEPKQPKQENKLIRVLAPVLNWVLRIGFGLLGVLVLLMILIQWPPVQNRLVQKISSTLSKELETEVRLEYLYLTFFDRLVLKGFYVEDLQGDTLLYSRHLEVDFVTNPFVVFRKGLVVEQVNLADAVFNLRKASGARETNLEIILNRLFPPREKKRKDKRPFHIDIRQLHLDRVVFLKEDMVQGQRLHAGVERARVRFQAFSLPDKRIDIRSLLLDKPFIRIDEREPEPRAVETTLHMVDSLSLRDTATLHLSIESFHLQNGQFALHNYRNAPVREAPHNELDYQHMEVFDINIDVLCFDYWNQVYTGEIDRISLRESSGFVLESLSARQAVVSPNRTALYDMKLRTPHSEIGDTLVFRHRQLSDYGYFPDAVNIEAYINNTSVALRDIMTFAPGLKNNTFFANNSEQVLYLDGDVSGRINNLRSRDLNLRLSDGSRLEGSFSARNLAVRNEEFVQLQLSQLVATPRTLRQLLPGLNLPENFNRLGRMRFQGSFLGFFADFVANGDLRTDIGRAVMDMRMNLKNGRGKANYSGKLSLENFDLGVWTDSPDFGLVNFTSEVKNGVGLTARTASASLTANIQSFVFKQYNYQNARLDGQLNRNLFDGTFSIQDDNVDLNFRGLLNYQDSVPVFDFQATVRKLDLKKLNLIKKDLVLAVDADINLRNDRLSQVEGAIVLDQITLIHNQKDTSRIAHLEANSIFAPDGKKVFRIESDIMQALIAGVFDIEQIPDIITSYFKRNYTAFWNRLNIKTKDKTLTKSDYTYNVLIKDSKNLMHILDEKLGTIKDLKLDGYYKSANDSLLVKVDLPTLEYNDIYFNDIAFTLRTLGDKGSVDLAISNTILNEKQQLDPIVIISDLRRDTLEFGINYYSTSYLDKLNVEGFFYPQDSTLFEVRIKPTNLVILEMPWLIDSTNVITFGKNYFTANNFTLTHQGRAITIENIGRRGGRARISNFDFDFINTIWDYKPLDFTGQFNAAVAIGNVFEMTEIRASVVADSFKINKDYFGQLRLVATAPNLKEVLNGELNIIDGDKTLSAKGFYNLGDLETPRGRGNPLEQARGYFDFEVNIAKYPLRIAEYFIGDVISNTVGEINGALRFTGPPEQPNTSGQITINDGSVTIDYLKTTYSFTNSKINVNNFLFDASGVTLRDKYGHSATVSGGIRHRYLRDFGLDARLRTQRFLALDTKKGDNKLFYGHALGMGDVRFSGPFNQIDVYINATVGDSTRIIIPISSDKEATELKFVKFVDKRRQYLEAEKKEDLSNPTGVSLEMNLGIRDEAEVELVFNEQTGDILKGSGRGNLRVLTPRNGDFQMFGDYAIGRGEYLFTLYNVVNKKFTVREGGYIQWTGDPFGAQINIEAEYRGLSTSVANFIQEYLVNTSAQIKNDASKSTQVGLIMDLRGELMRPMINFDIVFPALVGQLKAYADSKMNLLRRDQNELNRQVFGLIVVGQFLPANVALQGSEILYNTVSEFVSNQLSLLLTELFSEFIADGRVLSGIDFDIAYSQYQNVDLGNDQAFTRGDEFEVQLRQNFFNDRLTVLLGGNVDIGTNVRNAATAGTFVGNDVVIEYIISKDRSLKLRVYQRLQPDIGGQRLQVGTGLSFRKEFDSFGEFWRSLRKDTRAAKQNGF